jgi:hypothetical protein
LEVRLPDGIVLRGSNALSGEAFAMLQHSLARAADTAGSFFGLRRDVDTRKRLGVAGDKPVEA